MEILAVQLIEAHAQADMLDQLLRLDIRARVSGAKPLQVETLGVFASCCRWAGKTVSNQAFRL